MSVVCNTRIYICITRMFGEIIAVSIDFRDNLKSPTDGTVLLVLVGELNNSQGY